MPRFTLKYLLLEVACIALALGCARAAFVASNDRMCRILTLIMLAAALESIGIPVALRSSTRQLGAYIAVAVLGLVLITVIAACDLFFTG